MATFDYARLAQRALTLLARRGTTCRLYKNQTTGDLMDPIVTEVEHTVIAARTAAADWDNETGGTIRKHEFYVAANGVVPQDLDVLEFAGVRYTLSRVETMNVDGVTDIYFYAMGSTT